MISKYDNLYSLLCRLKQSRTRLAVQIPGFKDSFSSVIRHIDSKNHSVLLDKIVPETGHYHLLQYKILKATTTYCGLDISFETRLIRYNHDQYEHYTMTFPAKINYMQRRSDFRVQMDRAHRTLTAVYRQSEQPFRADVHDISLNGIGLVTSSREVLVQGGQLISCRMPLEHNEEINFTLEIKHISPQAPGRIRIGGCFSQLNQRSCEIISRYVRKMERLNLKI